MEDKIKDVTELLSERDNSFDSKNITNKSLGRVNANLVSEIESSGVTSEMLQSYPFPIFKYRTQITLHGQFESEKDCFISGGYKNLIINKNKSLGVRYSAIDINKKKLIGAVLRLENSPFYLHLDSQGCYIVHYLELTEQNLILMKDLFTKLPKNYVGFSQLYVSRSFFGAFIVIRVWLNAIFESEIYSFCSGLLQKDYSKESYLEHFEIDKQRKDAEYNQWELEQKQKEIEKLRLFNEAKTKFLEINKIKYLHSFDEGRYLFFKCGYAGELEIYLMHVWKRNKSSFMRYTEQIKDLTEIKATDRTHFKRKQIDKYKMSTIESKLLKDYYFKPAV